MSLLEKLSPALEQVDSSSGMAALRWISLGHGYEITGLDVLDAYTTVMQAAGGAEEESQIKAHIGEMISGHQANNQFMRMILAHHLSI